jgi:hypothetical protein
LEVPYYQAARFHNKKAAGAVYSVVQDILYQNVDCDLSVYRLKQERTFIVVVIGYFYCPSTLLPNQSSQPLNRSLS